MTDKLTDKQRAQVLRDLAESTWGKASTDKYAWLHDRADELDPPDPLAGLPDDQWVEVGHVKTGRCVMRVSAARLYGECVKLVRVVPDGDAREVLVIPAEEALEALNPGHHAWNLLSDALAEHEARWSS